MTNNFFQNTLAAAFVLSTLMACTSNGMSHGVMSGSGLSNPWERGENAFGSEHSADVFGAGFDTNEENF